MHNFSAVERWRELKFCKPVRYARESTELKFYPNRPSGCRATKNPQGLLLPLYTYPIADSLLACAGRSVQLTSNVVLWLHGRVCCFVAERACRRQRPSADLQTMFDAILSYVMQYYWRWHLLPFVSSIFICLFVCLFSLDRSCLSLDRYYQD